VEERRRKDSPDAQVLVWVAWQGSACAASQRLPGDVFTMVHRRAHTEHKHRSQFTKLQIGEVQQQRCSAATDPGGKDKSDLLR
jgi:hypothetical protein